MINYKLISKSLLEHKIVILPTETVYGLAIFYDDKIAYDKLIKLKQRDFDKPVAIMVSPSFDLDKYFYISDKARKVINKFLPGPLTVLLKVKKEFPYQCHSGTSVVGIRMPKDRRLIKILNKVNKPLQITSCNISSNPPCTTYLEASNLFSKSSDVGIIIKGKTKSNIPTSVVDLTSNDIKILREGEIKFNQIMEVLK